MKNIVNYIKEYGSFTFTQKPFNEVDNAVFSQLIYTDFAGISDGVLKPTLKEAAEEFYTVYSLENIENLINISARSARLLKLCADTKRYGDTVICRYVNNINDAIDKQFAAANFMLNDGSLLVAFRGTDVTVTGVKESAMLSYMFPVPAQIEALYYFQETAMLCSGDIRICGHSKGGNLAVFAAVNCSNSLKKRIVAVYEDDAPGFPKWFFDRYDYRQIKDKIHLFTPQSSIIGRMLYHDEKPHIIKSSNSGLKQHQVSSWIVDDDSFETAERYDHYSDFISEYINNLIDYIGDDLELFFDTLENTAEKIGIDDFYDLKLMDIKRIISIIDSISELDNEKNLRFKAVLKKAVYDFSKEYFSQKAKSAWEERGTYNREN